MNGILEIKDKLDVNGFAFTDFLNISEIESFKDKCIFEMKGPGTDNFDEGNYVFSVKDVENYLDSFLIESLLDKSQKNTLVNIAGKLFNFVNDSQEHLSRDDFSIKFIIKYEYKSSFLELEIGILIQTLFISDSIFCRSIRIILLCI